MGRGRIALWGFEEMNSNYNGTIKLHFATAKAAREAAVDGVAYAGMRYTNGRLKSWIAHVKKDSPYESYSDAAKRLYKKRSEKLIKENPIKPAGKARKSSRTIGQESQRYRTTKTGAKTKKPSARLLQRRSRDNVPGYYPNPIAKKFYIVQQVQKGLWYSVANFYFKQQAFEYCKGAQKHYGGVWRVIYSFPTANDIPSGGLKRPVMEK